QLLTAKTEACDQFEHAADEPSRTPSSVDNTLAAFRHANYDERLSRFDPWAENADATTPIHCRTQPGSRVALGSASAAAQKGRSSRLPGNRIARRSRNANLPRSFSSRIA